MNNSKEKAVSIEWESTGYTVLKNLNSSVLGIFCEFIDNSLQSYKDKKVEILKYDKDFRLRIDISYDGREIIIKDNAGGIDYKNFMRALKPANRPENTTGYNEYGLGMKYAAVWVSNEWELKSSAVGENVERKVLFNYDKVVNQNLKELPFEVKNVGPGDHYTEVRLRQLESKHVSPFRSNYLKNKIAFIYRNFIRGEESFYSNWKEDFVEFNVFGEKLKWEEYGFLKEQWWEDRQVNFNNNPPIEWKFKFDWTKIPYEEEYLDENGDAKTVKSEIEVSGFVGILPDGNHSGKNGFVLFRRGRVVEGTDGRIYPVDISGRSPRAFKYIRLYGEIHFRKVGISFDKTKLSINKKRRDEVFTVISSMIKKAKFHEFENYYNFISQADKHRAHFSRPTAEKAIEAIKTKKVEKSAENIRKEKIVAETNYDEYYDDKVKNKNSLEIGKLPEDEESEIFIGKKTYRLIITFSDNEEDLYIVNEDKNENKITITIGMSYPIFLKNQKLYEESYFSLILAFIKSLAISEIKANNGRNIARDVRYGLNDYLKLLVK